MWQGKQRRRGPGHVAVSCTDINTARRAGFGLDGDSESDEEDPEQQPLVREPVVFDAEALAGDEERGDMPRAAQVVHERDQTDIWAEIG